MAMVNPSLARVQAPSKTDYVLHPSIPICLPAFKLAPGLSRVEEGRQTCRPDGGVDGWMDGSIYSVVSALCRVRRGASITVARPSSPLASRPSPMSVAASFSPRSLPPAPTPRLPRQQQRTQTGALGALPSPLQLPTGARHGPWREWRLETETARPEIVTE